MKQGEKKIWLLGSSSFFNDFGSEMIAPILPFFIIALGGTGLAVGLLSGLREGLASIFKLFGGWYSDRVGKRMPFIFFGYFTSIIFRFLLALATSWHYIIAFVSLERFGKLRDAPRDAVIAVSTKKRGRGFGIQQMLDTGGAIAGSFVVLLLFWKLGLNFKTIIILAGTISAFSLIPLFFVKEPKTKKQKKSLFKGIFDLDKKLKYFIFVAGIFTLANFGLYMFLLLRAKQITGSIVVALALGVLFNFIWALFAIPFGVLSDKVGRKKILLLGYVLFFFVSLGFIFFSSLLSLISLFILFGFVYAITKSNQTALVSDLSGKMKATALGFYQFILGISSILGGVFAGLLWDINYRVMFIYLSIIALISIFFLLFVKEK
ncbi:MFS transporter [Candidatus Pacearchaeota archaeon]|nr:MAG: MFS transporter [Candidatus Pacearchaeota archaeon]